MLKFQVVWQTMQLDDFRRSCLHLLLFMSTPSFIPNTRSSSATQHKILIRQRTQWSQQLPCMSASKLEMWRSSNLTTFELRTLSTDSKFNECFKHFVVESEFVEKLLFYDWFHMHGAREHRLFFFKFNLSYKLQLLNVQHNFHSVMCYTALIWTLILLTSGYNILLQSFNWPKPVHYVLTDKINTSIRIRQILKVCEFWPVSSHH